MSFRENSFAKVWSVEKGKGNFLVAEMSSSKKNQKGEYETDWSNKFVRLVGTAAKQLEGKEIPKGGLSVKIGQCEVTNNYSKETKTTYTNYAIFNFHEEDGKVGNGGAKANTKANTKPASTMEEDDDLPF